MFELDRVVGMNYGETTKMVIESAKKFFKSVYSTECDGVG